MRKDHATVWQLHQCLISNAVGATCHLIWAHGVQACIHAMIWPILIFVSSDVSDLRIQPRQAKADVPSHRDPNSMRAGGIGNSDRRNNGVFRRLTSLRYALANQLLLSPTHPTSSPLKPPRVPPNLGVTRWQKMQSGVTWVIQCNRMLPGVVRYHRVRQGVTGSNRK